MKSLRALVMCTLMMTAPALAQEAPRPAAAQDGFVPVNAPLDAKDTMPAPMLVATAYGFIWIVLFAYLWSVRTRLATVEREMAAIGQRVAAGRK